MLKALAVKRAGRKSILVDDKERENDIIKKALESVEIESKNLM